MKITSEWLAEHNLELVEQPERQTIFKDGENWFKRSGEFGGYWPRGTWTQSAECEPWVIKSDRYKGGPASERLIPLPKIKVGQKWRCGPERVTIVRRADNGVDWVWQEHGKPTETYSAPQFIYKHMTLILTCPACGQECDEQDWHQIADALAEAARESQQALRDWLHQYAPEHCGAGDVLEAKRRVSDKGGTIAYIGDTDQMIDAALALYDAKGKK